MKMKGEMLEIIGAYGKPILGILILIVLIMLAITLINSHPEIGVKLPTIFGGTSGSGGG